jgi:hypothetical protein
MSDNESRLPARPSFEQLRKQAKDLLRQFRSGNDRARERFAAHLRRMDDPRRSIPSLADAQFVLAREAGFESWVELKRHLEQSLLAPFQKLAEDVLAVWHADDLAALARIHEVLGREPGRRVLRQQVAERVGMTLDHTTEPTAFSITDARLFVARVYGFGAWADLEASVAEPASRRATTVHGVSTRPPFYRIRWIDRSIEPRPPLSARDWEEIFDAMRAHSITRIHAGGQMTDAILDRLAKLDFVTAMDLSSSGRVTDEGMRHIAKMQRLESLNLSGCDITDRGLGALSQLSALREFYLYHQGGISDAGLANLAFCDQIERIDLLGCTAGDGVIKALTGKARLKHFKSGNLVTDAALPLLHQWPVFKTWQGKPPSISSLMSFAIDSNYLLLRGQITDRGMESLVGLEGLFALNLDDSRLSITAAGLQSLAALPHLEWFGFDVNDDIMPHIAALPRLRMLMCQDTSTGDTGFTALSRSQMLEYIWGRRCYNLTGRGFAALARMPALRGIAASCKNVDDGALSALPDFPALVEFMPMDVPDSGFRHVGRCERLEAVWCMYCRDTTDAATSHLTGLKHLRMYYAGQTRITDRSLEILSGMGSLEKIVLSSCAGVTDGGVAKLAVLPQLRELSLEYMPTVTRAALTSIPSRVKLNFET